jgi:hypothetical protein
VQPTMAAYGGHYRRGLAHRLEVLEGDWHPRALGMVEFLPSSRPRPGIARRSTRRSKPSDWRTSATTPS